MHLQAGNGGAGASLTDNQIATLHLVANDVAKIGCGKSACAYTAVDGTVVKITKDASDAWACHLLAQQEAPWAAKIFSVHRLPKNTFAVRMARCQPLPTAWAEPIEELFGFADEHKVDDAEMWTDVYKGCLREIEWLEAEHFGATLQDRNMRQALEIVNSAVQGLYDHGLDWGDFHSDNWGMLEGRPVLLDFGMVAALDGSSLIEHAKLIPVLPF